MAKPFQITLLPDAKPLTLKPGWHKRALAADRRHKVTTAPQSGNPAADAKAVSYALWLAARDNIAIPAGAEPRVDWQPCAHGKRPRAVLWLPERQAYRPAARGTAQPAVEPLLRIDLPHWDYEAPPVVETTLPDLAAPVALDTPAADHAAPVAVLEPCEPVTVAEPCEPAPVAITVPPCQPSGAVSCSAPVASSARPRAPVLLVAVGAADHIEPFAICPAVGMPCRVDCGFRSGCDRPVDLADALTPPGAMSAPDPLIEIGTEIMPKRAPVIRDNGTALIMLTRGLQAVVDIEDLDLVANFDWQAHARSDGNGFYARSSNLRMHRVILGCLPGELGDHRDGDGLNNRRSNLRIATRLQNAQNRLAPSKGLPVGVKEIRGRFYARIRHATKEVALGGFATADEAHAAFVAAASMRRGEWLHDSLRPSSASI